MVYCIIGNYVSVDYLCCRQTKLHVTSKGQGFENITYNAVSGIGIPKLLMNIISCHVFGNNKNSVVIFSCRRKLVDYYLQECFVLHEKNQNAFKNVPLREKQRINT